MKATGGIPADYKLPPGWNMQFDSATQRYYYWNIVTNETTWEPPMIEAPTPRSATSFQKPTKVPARTHAVVSTSQATAASSGAGSPLHSPRAVRRKFDVDAASAATATAPKSGGRGGARNMTDAPPITHCNSPQITLTKRQLLAKKAIDQLPPNSVLSSANATSSNATATSLTGSRFTQQHKKPHLESPRERTLSGGPPIISWPEVQQDDQNPPAVHPSNHGTRKSHSSSNGSAGGGGVGGRQSRATSEAITSPLSSNRKARFAGGQSSGGASEARKTSAPETPSSGRRALAPTAATDEMFDSTDWESHEQLQQDGTAWEDGQQQHFAGTTTMLPPRSESPGELYVRRGESSNSLLTRSFSTRKRRVNVVAESFDCSSSSAKKTFPKTTEETRMLEGILSEHFLFQQMSSEDRLEIVDAMQEIQIAKGHTVIKEGDHGDYFYVVGSGQFDVILQDKPPVRMDKGCFGELALLYNCPRAATIMAVTDAVVWALDRSTFRQMAENATRDHLDEAKVALQSVPLFRVLTEDQFDQIKSLVRFVDFKAGDDIITKGEVGNVFYIIRTGRVLCSEGEAVDREGNSQTLELKDHDYFGERALLTDEPRAANVVALTDTKVMALDRHAFNIILGPLREILDYNIRATVLQGVPLFNSLSAHEREKLFKAFSTVQFLPGDYIIRQGEPGTSFYLIRSGEAIVVQETEITSGRKARREVCTLTTGDHFGEMALTEGGPRQANVIAKGDCECFVLDRQQFEDLLGAARRVLDREANQRKLDNLKETELFTKAMYPKVVAQRAALHRRSSSIEVNRAHLTKHSIGDFEHIRTLGTGTFGRVRLVNHKPSGHTYALKIQSKAQIVKYKLKSNVLNEKDILMQLNNPFVIKLHQTFNDQDCLYMLLELVPGGELFSLLQTYGHRLTTQHQVFYTACVVSSFDAMHACDILYRDLKPENLLIDREGYLKLCDFGFAKVVKQTTFTLCGTPEYFSPELVLGKGYGKGNDYWAIGILVYEIVNGYTPFGVPEADQTEICRRIIKEQMKFPSDCDDEVGKDLITRLLSKDVWNRLGCGKQGVEAIKTHPWFRAMDFDKLCQKQYQAPWRPQLKDPLDCPYFDMYDENYRPPPYVDDGTRWDASFAS